MLGMGMNPISVWWIRLLKLYCLRMVAVKLKLRNGLRKCGREGGIRGGHGGLSLNVEFVFVCLFVCWVVVVDVQSGEFMHRVFAVVEVL